MTNRPSARRRAPLLPAAWVLLALAGCRSTAGPQETPPADDFDEFSELDEFEDFEEDGAPETWDPISGFNRVVHGFNDRFFLWVWNPVAKGYRWVLPEPARVCVDNFFRNLFTPPRLVNSLLQGRGGKAGTELGRFAVNSTVGIAGLFDPADAWLDWRAPSPEDFGQTLAAWGVGSGFPVVLPFLGPSNVRDGLSLFPNGFLNPVFYYTNAWEALGITTLDRVNDTSLHIGEYESLKADALDPYTLFRDAYHQNRLKKIEE